MSFILSCYCLQHNLTNTIILGVIRHFLLCAFIKVVVWVWRGGILGTEALHHESSPKLSPESSEVRISPSYFTSQDRSMLSIGRKFVSVAGNVGVKVNICRSFHTSDCARGFESFYDPVTADESFTSGRAWTLPDLRRKSFEDLHKLWFVLYKERNLLLTTKQKLKRTQRPVIASEEHRYDKVKRSMGAIKHVLNERRKIDKILGVSSSIPANYNKMDDTSK